MRPTHGAVSVAGVMPFSPTFDTVGVLARTSDVLERAMGVLLGATRISETADKRSSVGGLSEADGGHDWHSDSASETSTEGKARSASETPPTGDKLSSIHLVREAFALAGAEVREALEGPVEHLRAMFGASVRETSLGELCGDAEAGDLAKWLDVFRLLRGAEVDSCLGAWVAATHPKFGPAAAAGFELVRQLDRSRVGDAVRTRERLSRALQGAMGPRDLLCIPTAPTLAPIKGTASHDRHGDYYSRTISLTSIAGVARLPQVSMPLAKVGGVPIGISLVGARGEDVWLLRVAGRIQ